MHMQEPAIPTYTATEVTTSMVFTAVNPSFR